MPKEHDTAKTFGRPPVGATVKKMIRYHICLHQETRDVIAAYGDGNLAEGVRRLARLIPGETPNAPPGTPDRWIKMLDR